MTEGLDPEALRAFIAGLEGVAAVEAQGDWFFFEASGEATPENQRFPFATLVTGDRYDQASDLERPGVFRLNLGVAKATAARYADEAPDFTTLDQIMPHPVYGRMHWLCVLNPGERSGGETLELIREAYALAQARAWKRG